MPKAQKIGDDGSQTRGGPKHLKYTSFAPSGFPKTQHPAVACTAWTRGKAVQVLSAKGEKDEPDKRRPTLRGFGSNGDPVAGSLISGGNRPRGRITPFPCLFLNLGKNRSPRLQPIRRKPHAVVLQCPWTPTVIGNSYWNSRATPTHPRSPRGNPPTTFTTPH